LKEVKDRFDIITFRAFHPLADILDVVAELLSENGYVCAYKAVQEQVEEGLVQVKRTCKSPGQRTLYFAGAPPGGKPYALPPAKDLIPFCNGVFTGFRRRFL
jgi:hypothetical protein